MNKILFLQALSNIFILFFLLLYPLLLVGIMFGYRIARKRWKIFYWDFSYLNFYILISPFALAMFYAALIMGIPLYTLALFVLGFLGMSLEIAFSFLWKLFFAKPCWIYLEGGLGHNYTSKLNFIPWSVSTLMFAKIFTFFVLLFQLSQPDRVLSESTLLLLLLTIIELVLGLLLNRRSGKPVFTNFSLTTYLAFCINIIIALLYIAIKFNPVYSIIFLLLGLAAFVTEYIYGRLARLFLSKKLWLYNYAASDDQHLSPTNIIPATGVAIFFLFLLFSSLTWIK